PAFRERFPEYDAPAIDRLRATEYARLDAQGQVYLDYTGGSLYAAGQLREHLDLLAGGVFGNPHSASPTSLAATALAEGARRAVLAHFNAAPEEYSAVFTLNASGAIKLVGEAYPFVPGSTCLLTADNHNSVNGLRELARAKGARTAYVDVRLPELTVPEAALQSRLEAPAAPGAARLFAYPAQSNFSGAQHPLDWIARARALGWDVLLDAAAYAPTNRLDLGRWHPDYVAISFYKLFGYPTGIGCLIARKAALKRLRRPWFAGGTVTIASVRAAGHRLAAGPAAFEDGTINYLGLPAVTVGLRHLEAVGLDAVHARVRALTGWLLAALPDLRHSNGRPLVRLYGPATTAGRGATVAFNLLTPAGAVIEPGLVEAGAAARRISLRTGCFCNPGASEAAFDLPPAELAPFFRRPVADDASEPAHEAAAFKRRLAASGRAVGAVRASFGIASSFADVAALLALLETYRDRPDRPDRPDPTDPAAPPAGSEAQGHRAAGAGGLVHALDDGHHAVAV
ncbi:MAG TPA: aminotransferase class V-fold PLP-dependent enzyme, partial [Chloroflexota bacterium]|nr:aminotransferase class V-fold PLP-dependent enzyme [Chloroflexota bacterium]